VPADASFGLTRLLFSLFLSHPLQLRNAAGHTPIIEAEYQQREQVVAWLLINTEPDEELQDGDDDDEDDEEEEEEDEEEEAQASTTKA